METIRFDLPQSEIPTSWYNVQADLPEPLPPVIHPGRMDPIGPDDLASLFAMELIKQEVSQEREIPIPEPVREIYGLWRPTPLFRARRLEQELDTPAQLYYKYEGVSPVGSHKPNTAVAQAFYNREEGVTQLTTETGAGQWGSALAMAGAFLGVDCEVYMVRVSYDGKPYRRSMMEAYGASVTASPSSATNAGRQVLESQPDSPGSLGIAISEAVEAAATSGGSKKYCLGSVLNHVLMHQTVIGREAQAQFERAGVYPDVMVGFEAQAVPQVPVFEAAQLFARTEGIVPAPEPAHAVRVAIDEALRCKEAGESKVIAINLCGHGHFDMQAYRSFLDGQLVNYEYPQERITEALAELPAVG